MKAKIATPYIAHILESVALIREYVRGGKAVFLEDSKTYDAVIRRLHTLAEATVHLPEGITQAHPEIPWQAIAAFRHILVHEYLGTIDADKVWQVIEKRLPELEAVLSQYKGDLK
ncbi:MAG: HepT-like ribonuclease domain-containing protein [Alphaproteobacteria bacterium]|nr:HepT-like ribonuclease domain-containing protein [Alphaproteobacteria bacterium]